MESIGQWYIEQDGQPTGPFSAEDMLAWAREGHLQPGQLVWHPDFGPEWRPARTVEALAAAFPVTTPARGGTAATTPNGEITRRARQALKGHWAKMLGITLVACALYLAVVGVRVILDRYAAPLGSPASFLLMVWLNIGLGRVLLAVADGESPHLSRLFIGFRRWGVGVVAQILISVMVVLFLAAMALIVLITGAVVGVLGARVTPSLPVTLAALVICVLSALFVLRYYWTFWIIADDPEVGPVMAIRRSVQLMRGRIWKFICFQLRFVGWGLLAILTCGLGFLFLVPYVGVATALWYRDALPPEM